MAELFEVLALARPQDAAEVLRGLDDELVVRALERTATVLPAPVREYLVRYGSSAVTVALAGSLARLVSSQDADSVRRGLLRRFDEATDIALFDAGSVTGGAWYVRRAILRDRRGLDGHAVISPALRESILAGLAEARGRVRGTRGSSYSRALERFQRVLLVADDPDLVEAVLPDPLPAQLPQLARALLTLHESGRLAEQRFAAVRRGVADADTGRSVLWRDLHRMVEDGTAEAESAVRLALESNLWVGDRLPESSGSQFWGSPGFCAQRYALPWQDVLARARTGGPAWRHRLDEAAYREDIPPEVRVPFQDSYANAVLMKMRPDWESLSSAPKALTRALASPAVRHRTMRSLMLRGLEHGTLDAVDVIMLAEPAAEALALAVPDPVGLDSYHKDHLYVGFLNMGGPAVRGRAATRAVLAALLKTWIGDDPELWNVLLTQAATWPGSVGSLVKRVAGGGEFPEPSVRAPRWPRGVDAADILLSFAPEGIAELFVEGHADPGRRGLITRMLDRAPLSRALVEHALGPDGTSAMRFALARNPETPLSVLWQLVRREPVENAVLGVLYFNARATEDMRAQIILRCEAAGGLHPRLAERLADETAQETLAPILASKDPVRLHSVLRRINNVINPLQRARAYAKVAEQAGPEVVWALDLERTGSLDGMAESVRASMASGDAAPLIAAATVQDPAGDASYAEQEIAAGDFDDWRLADLIREHLDDQPERWRALTRLMAEQPDRPAEELVRGVVADESGSR